LGGEHQVHHQDDEREDHHRQGRRPSPSSPATKPRQVEAGGLTVGVESWLKVRIMPFDRFTGAAARRRLTRDLDRANS